MNKIRWSTNDVQFLIDNYTTKGVTFVSESLNKSRTSVMSKAFNLNIKVDKDILYYNEQKLKEVVKKSLSITEVLRRLNKSVSGAQFKVIQKYILKYCIDTSHFTPYANNVSRNRAKSLDFWLQLGTNITSNDLKKKLYNASLKEKKCELCNQGEDWYGKKISLILDHINGVNNDNRLENLRIVCPNCNATLDTHCRGYKNTDIIKNKRYSVTKESLEKYYCGCGNKKNKISKTCKPCNEVKQRKVIRPDITMLKYEVDKLGFVAVGRKYGVSDNTIRKWVK